VVVVKKVLKEGLPEGIVLNVNVPDLPQKLLKGYRFTKQGKRNYGEIIAQRIDPKGRPYYWISGDENGFMNIDGSDCNAVKAGYVSITPLRVDITDVVTLKKISEWKL
jgi:5'-nucleotidase